MLKKSQLERVEGERWCEEFSAGYYGLCTAGGMLSAGVTHLAITPLDVLKVNMQVNPLKYRGISSGFITLWREQGRSALWRGWSGKLFGYGVQGGCKFGLYEYFKRFYTDLLVDQQRSVIFFLSSASAQVFADVALCPFEAVKIQVQTQPHFARGLTDGFRKLYANEGLSGFFKGLFPLWGRNLPFSMIMFSTFEHSVDLMYRKVIQRRKEDCSRAQQLGVTCLSGYVAGSVGTVISNPADNIVSFLYNKKADTIRQAIKKIGLVNLFTRSLPVRIAIVGPVVTLQWFLYDTIKLFTGLPTSGGLTRHQKDPNLLLQ
ncbi:mitochondrial phosphate carrier protein 1, mitochondrial-like isoform X2 [Nicotiana tomentosiformis]|uniref:mitochondrial phosphate carrier protein 1, mitochondrial-like isoform X2 n=1 Tax=Nicotiana tomentosiformis TaxID=4098 RepID=UPI00051B0523|nr:mitochondrial phosphate carrier protein 1, mitochondrial-like isoform X2 [Nicotiana tomentosiformis]XP_009586668.1 mitochondrial phosphate carrier protein 1, mitochondrial-like isoform X2 [Nicotiana tomentosiformis]XP_009586669.1 mitochondrial phosphate carrier protein 1, mitochondrial-like isoform X2 [Nicotiana tomentosiformis]